MNILAAEVREPWTLPGSIFKPRAKEADARAFYDGGAVRLAARASGLPAQGCMRLHALAACLPASINPSSSSAAACLPAMLQLHHCNAAQTLDKLFEHDWQRAVGKEKFTSMLARENKGNTSGKSDKAAMQDVHDVLRKHYQV